MYIEVCIWHISRLPPGILRCVWRYTSETFLVDHPVFGSAYSSLYLVYYHLPFSSVCRYWYISADYYLVFGCTCGSIYLVCFSVIYRCFAVHIAVYIWNISVWWTGIWYLAYGSTFHQIHYYMPYHHWEMCPHLSVHLELCAVHSRNRYIQWQLQPERGAYPGLVAIRIFATEATGVPSAAAAHDGDVWHEYVIANSDISPFWQKN